MSKHATTSALSLAASGALLALVNAAPAAAAPVKVWVANNGVDSPTCGAVNAPCLGLQQAHDNVMAGGDVSVLTPIDFGLELTISKSVNITNDGVGEASIVVTAGNITGIGITVDANVGDMVSVRGLVIDGQAIGTTGIQVVQASAVHIQNCVIRSFEHGVSTGIFVNLASSGQVFVSDTIVYNNGSTALTAGIWVRPFGNVSANVVLDRVHLENNVIGLRVEGQDDTGSGSHVVIRDSVVSGNASDGILAHTVSGKGPSFVVVEHTSVVNNGGVGIHADGPRATMVLNDDTVTRNASGISAVNFGQLLSFGNNKNFNNVGPEGAPTGSFSPM